MKPIFLLIAIACLCLSCGNRSAKNSSVANDSIKIHNEEAAIICVYLKEFQDIDPPEIPTDDSTYKAFFYYKNGKKDLSVLKDEDITVQWSNQLDTTLVPIDGFFKIEISTKIVLSDFLNTDISWLVDVDNGLFKNGLKDGEWMGAMCGGMNDIMQFHIFYTEGVIDSLHYFDCPFHHKEDIPEGATYNTQYFYFKNNLPHGNCFEIIHHIHEKSYDTVIVEYNNGKLVNLPKRKDKNFDGLEDDPQYYHCYTYLKYKTANNKKEGEWVTSGSYEKTEQGDLHPYSNKNIVISSYSNDLLHGDYIVANFYKELLPPPDNQPKTIFYKTEFRNGTGYYINEDLTFEGQLRNGNKSGVWKHWRDSIGGELEETGVYINDKKHGVWKSYSYPDKYGKLTVSSYSLYYNGRLLYKGEDLLPEGGEEELYKQSS